MLTWCKKLLTDCFCGLLKQRRNVLRQVNNHYRIGIRWVPSQRYYRCHTEPLPRIHSTHMHEQLATVGFQQLPYRALITQRKIVVK